MNPLPAPIPFVSVPVTFTCTSPRRRAPDCRGRRHRALAAVVMFAACLFGPTMNSARGAESGAAPQGSVGDATDGVVWGALVYATAGEAPETAMPEQRERFEKVLPRLKRAFDFENFFLLGQHTQEIFSAYESWVVPSEDLFLRIDSKGPAEGGGINLHLQVWQRQRVLVKTDAVLRPDSPLFIRGPNWRDGSLIFVVLAD